MSTHASASTVWSILGDPVGHRDRNESIMSFDAGSRLFTIQPLAPETSFVIFTKGQRRHVFDSPQTYTITNDVGLHFMYFDDDGVLQESLAFPGFDSAFTAIVYWDGSKAVGLADERHGANMPYVVHEYAHRTIGTRYQHGGDLVQLATGSGGVNADAQVSLTDTEIWDEDIQIEIVRSATPSAPFEQELGFSTATPGELPVYYRIGADGHWTKDTATTFPMRPWDGSAPGVGNVARVGYNLDTAGTWSVADPGANNRYIAMWIYATNSQDEPIIAVMGQRWDNVLGNAEDNNTIEGLNLGDLPFPEFKVLYRLIVRTNNGYANGINGYIASVQDLRSVSNIPAGQFNPTSHNALGDRSVFPTHPSTSLSHEQTAPPATGELGQMIWDTSAAAGSELKVWDGAGWKIVTYTP